jgi:hypothetical protein
VRLMHAPDDTFVQQDYKYMYRTRKNSTDRSWARSIVSRLILNIMTAHSTNYRRVREAFSIIYSLRQALRSLQTEVSSCYSRNTKIDETKQKEIQIDFGDRNKGGR